MNKIECSRVIADRLIGKVGELKEGPIVTDGVGYRVEFSVGGPKVTHMWDEDSPELYCSVEDHPEQLLRIAIEGGADWPSGSALAEADLDSVYYETTNDCGVMVIDDGSSSDLESAVREQIEQITGVLTDPLDIDSAIYGDKYSIAVHMSYDTSICCECHETVLHADPYSGMPQGTTFRDGEGYVCHDCNAADPKAAIEESLASQHNGHFLSSPTWLDADHPPEGWVVAEDLTKKQADAIAHARPRSSIAYWSKSYGPFTVAWKRCSAL